MKKHQIKYQLKIPRVKNSIAPKLLPYGKNFGASFQLQKQGPYENCYDFPFWGNLLTLLDQTHHPIFNYYYSLP